MFLCSAAFLETSGYLIPPPDALSPAPPGQKDIRGGKEEVWVHPLRHKSQLDFPHTNIYLVIQICIHKMINVTQIPNWCLLCVFKLWTAECFQLLASLNPTHELCRNFCSTQHLLEEELVKEIELDFSTVFASAVWRLTSFFLENVFPLIDKYPCHYNCMAVTCH